MKRNALIAVAIAIIGGGIGLWIALSSPVVPRFPPPVLNKVPSIQSLNQQVKSITPPWNKMTQKEKKYVYTLTQLDVSPSSSSYNSYNNISAAAFNKIYYSTPLCTPRDLKVAIGHDMQTMSPYPTLNVQNVSHHNCNTLNPVPYGNSLRCGGLEYLLCVGYASFAPYTFGSLERSEIWQTTCYPAVQIYDQYGHLVATFGDQGNVFEPSTFANNPGRLFWGACNRGGPTGWLLTPRKSQSFARSLKLDNVKMNVKTYHSYSAPEHIYSVIPPGHYWARAVIPIGYLPPMPNYIRTGPCPRSNSASPSKYPSCPPDNVILYYAKPVPFTVQYYPVYYITPPSTVYTG
jgi:hypothetical protein